MSTPPPENALRKRLRCERETLTADQKKQAAQQAAALLKNHHAIEDSRNIGCYLSQEGELDPSIIMDEALQKNKNIYLPALHPTKKNELHFLRYLAQDDLVKNRFGIEEPSPHSSSISAWTLDLIIVPLVAFDRQGNRLGRGAGFYDRSLCFVYELPEAPRPILIGYAYAMQEVEPLQKKSWDVPMDYIVTEKEIIDCRHQKSIR